MEKMSRRHIGIFLHNGHDYVNIIEVGLIMTSFIFVGCLFCVLTFRGLLQANNKYKHERGHVVVHMSSCRLTFYVARSLSFKPCPYEAP